MWWSFLFLRISAVHSFVTRTPLVVSGSYPAASRFNNVVGGNDRYHQLLKHVPIFGRLRMVDGVMAEVENETESVSTVPTTTTSTTSSSTTNHIPNEQGTIILVNDDEFTKPDLDMREYRIIQLKNNLQALIVSTSKTTTSAATGGEEEEEGDDDSSSSYVEAASMHIQAGHFDDPIPGLAHFYEHMLVSPFPCFCCFRGEREGKKWDHTEVAL